MLLVHLSLNPQIFYGQRSLWGPSSLGPSNPSKAQDQRHSLSKMVFSSGFACIDLGLIRHLSPRFQRLIDFEVVH